MTHLDMPSLAELRKQRKPVRNINQEHRKKLTRLQRYAIWITAHIGTMGFFLIIFAWTVLWLGWNILAPSGSKFDPYPGFILWLFISNMIQIFLMPLLMIGQNIQGQHAEARSEADYETDTKAEREIEAILMHLENQNEMILQILQKLELEGSPTVAADAISAGSEVESKPANPFAVPF
jgi:uncharacterized membrane protein